MRRFLPKQFRKALNSLSCFTSLGNASDFNDLVEIAVPPKSSDQVTGYQMATDHWPLYDPWAAAGFRRAAMGEPAAFWRDHRLRRSSCGPKKSVTPQQDGNSRLHYTKKRSHFHQPFVHFERPSCVSDFSHFGGPPLRALRKARSRCLDQLPVFELALKKRGRTWRWHVCTSEGAVVMQGSEASRPAAKYKAHRALFLLLLSAPYRSIQLSTPRSPQETI